MEHLYTKGQQNMSILPYLLYWLPYTGASPIVCFSVMDAVFIMMHALVDRTGSQPKNDPLKRPFYKGGFLYTEYIEIE